MTFLHQKELSSLKKWRIPGLGQSSYEMNLDYLIMPEYNKIMEKYNVDMSQLEGVLPLVNSVTIWATK